MGLRAWRMWGVSIVLVGGLALAKPPIPPETDGKVPPRITQDLNQPEPTSTPRLLPESIRGTSQPTPLPLPTAGPTGEVVNRLLGTSKVRRASAVAPESAIDHKARLAFETAEAHFEACESAEADAWYREVIRLAPDSSYAAAAANRLSALLPVRFDESREPPIAGNELDLSAVQLRVLWEAARQYKEAIASGERTRIDDCSRTLESVLRLTKK